MAFITFSLCAKLRAKHALFKISEYNAAECILQSTRLQVCKAPIISLNPTCPLNPDPSTPVADSLGFRKHSSKNTTLKPFGPTLKTSASSTPAGPLPLHAPILTCP